MSIQTALSDLLDNMEVRREGVVFSRKGKIAYIRCPFHDENTPSFRITPDLSYHCFGCGKEGNCRDDLEAIKEGLRPEDLMSAEE